MAGPIQTTVTAFWSQLQKVENQIKSVEAALNADKAKLTALYSRAKQEFDPAGAHDRAYLEPLIHNNSTLRMSYLAPVKSKFNSAVASASSVLKSAGYNTPSLDGLGVVPAVIVVPAIAVAALGVAAAAVVIVNRLTQTQIARTATAQRIFSDTNTTPEQKLQLAAAFQKEMESEKKNTPPPPGFDTSWILPTAAVIALIILGPQLLQAFNARSWGPRGRATS